MSVDSRPVVLVTGAARRVGRAIALELAAHGFDVAVHSHRASDESIDTLQAARAAGARAEAFVADLADETACRALLPAVAERMGRIDAVVNNASRFEYDGAGDCSYASMAEHWQVNTAAPVLLAAALHQRLSGSAGRGCVVNLLDQKLWNPNPDHFSYTLSKAALEAATTLQAQAFAPTLRVVGVAPGVTLPSGPMDSTEFVRAHAMTPLRRSSTPEDVARAVRFLIESPAITGTTLLVDGGQHLSAQPRDVLFLAREGV
ncbi:MULTISPECIES: SDR family oxidoreductase [unclassified Methylibium]|uniref:SDR family oxidoreductase n=1 Tax=unclassified Methylibium TaxID=2633235 RepID=UPI0003F3DEB0|nr:MULTISPECIES: SDR family oxidoreductase [unclassified Methylibium]EWS56627.1 Glucose 1-dehydrogenase 2 [Methylibium sp. T29]EWS61682.1 Glucose 1-dehydrogenase 2 [Methylibium sp. T29-B]